jgi:transposase InsO family protein
MACPTATRVELLAERGIVVDHVTIYRWVQTFTVEFIDAARPTRHCAGDRWFVDETYVKVAGGWTYLYRAVDQHGQVIDVLVSTRRNAAAAQAFFARALRYGPAPGRSRPRDGAADRHVHRHPGCDHRSSSFQEDSKRILSGSWCTSVGRFRREPDPGMCAGV